MSITLEQLGHLGKTDRLAILKKQGPERLAEMQISLRRRISNLNFGVRGSVTADSSQGSGLVQRPDLTSSPEYQQGLRAKIEGLEALLQDVDSLLAE